MRAGTVWVINYTQNSNSALGKVQKVAKKVPKISHNRILFTDLNIFNIKSKFNPQNDVCQKLLWGRTKFQGFRGVIAPCK